MISVATIIAMPARAQSTAPTDATTQEFLRQQERERALRQQLERTPDARLKRPETHDHLGRLPTDESPCFTINRIVLQGDAAERFQWTLAQAEAADAATEDAAVGRCVGARGINLVMRRMQNAIVQRGFVTTRVLAEPQDLSSGTLTLTLIPGRVRNIHFAADSDHRATLWNAMPVQPGDLLNLRDIEQALENFKRVPTADADIQIIPAGGAGARPGDSDLVIGWKQPLPFRLSISADDSGSKTTGKYQGAVTLSYDHMLTLNDLFYASVNHDLGGADSGRRGTRGYAVHYSIPFGYWLLGFTTSEYDYHQSVTGINQSYLYSGESRNTDIRLSRLIYRDAVRKTTVSLRGWQRTSKNFIDDVEIEVQRRRMAGWEVGLVHREFIGRAILDLNIAYRRGTGAMEALHAPEENFNEGTSRPKLVTFDGQLSLPFSLGEQRLRYSSAWRAQWNRTPLVPQDRFSIGGRYTVRGFDGESVLSSDRGWIVRNDLGIAIGQSGQELYLGVDYGEVSGPSSDTLIGKRLAGAALGLRGSYKNFSYDVFVGKPLKKPDGFETKSTVAGFNVNWSF